MTFKLFLSPNALRRYGAIVDEMYPQVELYETSLRVGDAPRKVRGPIKEMK